MGGVAVGGWRNRIERRSMRRRRVGRRRRRRRRRPPRRRINRPRSERRRSVAVRPPNPIEKPPRSSAAAAAAADQQVHTHTHGLLIGRPGPIIDGFVVVVVMWDHPVLRFGAEEEKKSTKI